MKQIKNLKIPQKQKYRVFAMEIKQRRIKFPIRLPKGFWEDGYYYELKSVWLKNNFKWNEYPRNWYVQIHYENKETGYNQYFSKWGGYYLFNYYLGIEYEDFRKAEKEVIQSLGLKEFLN